MTDQTKPHGLRDELTSLINRYSRENASNTPDFLLAGFLIDCLANFEETVRARDRWYDIAPEPGFTTTETRR
jgi:hypothetical protein